MARLRSKFEKIGKVVDLFIPKKLDKVGKPFGFVRFADYLDEDELLKALNNVWIESYKIRAFYPKYDRENPAIDKKEKVPVIRKDNLRVDEKSYACIVEEKENDNGKHITAPEKSQSILTFKTTREETKWLDECITGMLRSKFSWEEYGEELQEECGNFFNIRYMGEDILY